MPKIESVSLACVLWGLTGCSQGPLAIGEAGAGQANGAGSGGSASHAAGADGRSGATRSDTTTSTGGKGGSADQNTGGQDTMPGTAGTSTEQGSGGTDDPRPDQGTGGKNIQLPDQSSGGSAGAPSDPSAGALSNPSQGGTVGSAGALSNPSQGGTVGSAGALSDPNTGGTASNAGGAAGAGGQTAVCEVALPLRCGDRLAHSTIVQGRPNQWYGYACTQRWESGRETIYAFVTEEDCQVEIRLVDLTEDLDLIMIKDCDPSPCGACQADSATMSNADECSSVPLDLQAHFVEKVNFDTLAGQAHVVVVDGYDYSEGTYTLEVDCVCG
ncbi:MAG: hypothetical protein JW940_38810 [Polyangiaceae bacterium]|nr:hypothetical protein [Polyangiaceae bacterium]